MIPSNPVKTRIYAEPSAHFAHYHVFSRVVNRDLISAFADLCE